MSLSLTVEPSQKEIVASGGTFELILTNNGSERLAFKVKCNNNNFYTFKPVHGIIGVGQTRKLEVVRSYGPVSFDKVAINVLPAPIGVYDPLEPFKDSKAQPEVVNVLLSALEKVIDAPSPSEIANQNSYVPTLR